MQVPIVLMARNPDKKKKNPGRKPQLIRKRKELQKKFLRQPKIRRAQNKSSDSKVRCLN